VRFYLSRPGGGDRDFLPEGEVSDGELGAYTVSLSFPRAVDAVEADAFSALVVEDFETVAVDHSQNSFGDIGSETRL
jgi:hypothetical protein